MLSSITSFNLFPYIVYLFISHIPPILPPSLTSSITTSLNPESHPFFQPHSSPFHILYISLHLVNTSCHSCVHDFNYQHFHQSGISSMLSSVTSFILFPYPTYIPPSNTSYHPPSITPSISTSINQESHPCLHPSPHSSPFHILYISLHLMNTSCHSCVHDFIYQHFHQSGISSMLKSFTSFIPLPDPLYIPPSHAYLLPFLCP
jgi:hypothetical protein